MAEPPIPQSTMRGRCAGDGGHLVQARQARRSRAAGPAGGPRDGTCGRRRPRASGSSDGSLVRPAGACARRCRRPARRWRSSAVGRVIRWSTRRRASAWAVQRMTCLILGRAAPCRLISSRPRPSSTSARRVSEPISPQRPTQMPAAWAASHRAVDAAQDGRMQGLVEVGHPAVAPVHGQGVLDEVVGADAEEVAFGGQQVGHQHRRRGLDHDAQVEVRVVGQPLAGQFRRGLGHDLLGLAQLLDAGDHGEHQRARPAGRRAQDGPDLGLEQGAVGQQEADAAPAQERVVLALGARGSRRPCRRPRPGCGRPPCARPGARRSPRRP